MVRNYILEFVARATTLLAVVASACSSQNGKSTSTGSGGADSGLDGSSAAGGSIGSGGGSSSGGNGVSNAGGSAGTSGSAGTGGGGMADSGHVGATDAGATDGSAGGATGSGGSSASGGSMGTGEAGADPCGQLVLPCVVTSRGYCGRIFDVGTTTPVAGSFRFRLYDPILFATSGLAATSTEIDNVAADTCGRFEITDPPADGSSGFTVAVVDEPGGARLPTASLIHVPTTGVSREPAFSLSPSTANAWSSSLGLADVLARNVGVLIFARVGTSPTTPPLWTPSAGVTPTNGGNPVTASSAHFFTDSDAMRRLQLNGASSSTSADGSVVLLDLGPLSSLGGTGAEPTGCSAWSTVMTPSAAGALVVVPLRPVCP